MIAAACTRSPTCRRSSSALIQGIAEPFPVSSLGHSVILPKAFGWNIHQNDDYFLAFLVATHCATAIVLFFFFLEDWKRIFRGLGRSIRGRGIAAGRHRRQARLAARDRHGPGRDPRPGARAPAAHALRLARGRGALPDPQRRPAARLREPAAAPARSRATARATPTRGSRPPLSFRQAAAIGTAQAAALIPGISRSGVTMGGGLIVGLSNEDAARFAFLLATPIIAAAGVLKLPELFGSAGDGVRGQALVGALAAAFTTYLAVKFLLRFFQTNRLTPFGIYCIVAGHLQFAFAFSPH